LGGKSTIVSDVATIVAFCAVSTALTVVMCSSAWAFGHATQLLDRPDGLLKLHTTDTPLVGGLALLTPVFAASTVYFLRVADVPFMLVALLAAAITLVIGVIDDRIGVSPRWRLAALTVVVFGAFAAEPLFVLHALRFTVRGYNFGIQLGWLAAPITALMIIGFVNATNMADGMNGQLLGSVLIWSVFIVRYIGPETGMPFLAIISSGIVTLAYNLRGRLFSGSSGAYTVALFVGLGTIATYRQSGAVSAVEPILWFWLPVLDCLRLMASRRLAGKSPFFGDRNHIHHILQEYVRWPYALFLYLALLAAPGVATLLSDRLVGCFVLLASIACYAGFVYLRRPAKSAEEADSAVAAPVPHSLAPLAE